MSIKSALYLFCFFLLFLCMLMSATAMPAAKVASMVEAPHVAMQE